MEWSAVSTRLSVISVIESLSASCSAPEWTDGWTSTMDARCYPVSPGEREITFHPRPFHSMRNGRWTVVRQERFILSIQEKWSFVANLVCCVFGRVTTGRQRIDSYERHSENLQTLFHAAALRGM